MQNCKLNQSDRNIQDPNDSLIERTTNYASSITGRQEFSPLLQKKSHRKNSIILFESQEMIVALSQIKTIANPLKYIELLDPLQLKIWNSLQKLSQTIILNACLVEVLIIDQQTEYEFQFDLQNLAFFMKVSEVCENINQLYQLQKNHSLKNPYVSILIGRIKTQKLDPNMLLYELLNIMVNGQKILVLQELA